MSSRRHKNTKYNSDLFENYSKEKRKRKKCNKEIMSELHRSRLELIAQDPSLIGINSHAYTQIELPFYSNQTKMGELDILIFDEEKNYFIEYKCNDCEPNRIKAKNQLLKAKEYMDERFKRNNLSLLYVHDKFIVEELTIDGWRPFNLSK